MRLPMISSMAELEKLILDIGFLPFFRSNIPGFSVEDCISADHWFVKDVEGPWEWKGKIAAKGEIAYGKLFHNKAGFVSKQWYPHLANYRRDGYDFDALYEDGLAGRKCKRIMDMLELYGPSLSYQLKRWGGFGKHKETGFDSAVTLLQMQTYITIKTFTYRTDRYGQPYGWGVAQYARSEDVFGADFVRSAYADEPGFSKEKIRRYISRLLPGATDKQIEILIK